MRISDWSSDVCSSDLRGRRLAGSGLPAPAHQLAQRQRSLAVDHQLHVMEGTIALAPRIAAPRIVERVLGGIPPSDRQVEAAGEGHGVVDHHQLLVMAGADRQHVVRSEEHTSELQSLMRISYAVF